MKKLSRLVFVLSLISGTAFGYLLNGDCYSCSFDTGTQTLRCTCWSGYGEERGITKSSKSGCLFFNVDGDGFLQCDDSYKQAGDKKAQVAYLIKQGFGPGDFIEVNSTLLERGFKPEDFKQLLILAIRQQNALEMLKKLAEKGLTVSAADYAWVMNEALALDKQDVVEYLRQQRAR